MTDPYAIHATRRTIATLADLDADTLTTIVDTALDFIDVDDREPIDWDHVLLKVERYTPYDLPETYESPVLRKVQRAVRAAVREARMD